MARNVAVPSEVVQVLKDMDPYTHETVELVGQPASLDHYHRRNAGPRWRLRCESLQIEIWAWSRVDALVKGRLRAWADLGGQQGDLFEDNAA